MAAVPLSRLAGQLTGRLILPGQDGYREVRKSRPATLTEPLPRAVVRCATAQDAVRALGFAQEHGLAVAVRSGGHSLADLSSTAGLLIDCQLLDSIEVTADTVTVGPGVRVGALADRLAGQDRLVPCGWCPTVGVVGAVLGGGFGMFGRAYGLGCDHLVAAEVALADGRVVQVDRDREADLFWALRGAGGGTFGIVTSIVLRTRPAPRSTSFGLTWRHQHAARVIESWQEWAPRADDTVNAELVVAAGADPATIPLAVLFGVVVGPQERAAAVLERFERLVGAPGRRLLLTELPGREAARQHMYAGVPADATVPGPPPPGLAPGRRVVRSEFFDQPVPRPAIDDLVEWLVRDRVPGQYRELEFIPWRGAYQRIPPGGTAFAHRSAWFLLEHNADVGPGADPPARQGVAEWVDRSWQISHRWGSGRVYPNYPDPWLPGSARAYHGPHLERLTQVKASYDPRDVFHLPQSVPLPDRPGTPS